jgi:hypothetical protein
MVIHESRGVGIFRGVINIVSLFTTFEECRPLRTNLSFPSSYSYQQEEEFHPNVSERQQ